MNVGRVQKAWIFQCPEGLPRVSDRLVAWFQNASDAQLRWAAASVQSRAHARQGGELGSFWGEKVQKPGKNLENLKNLGKELG